MSHRWRRASGLLAGWLLSILVACSPPKDPIERLLEAVKTGAMKRNADAVLAHLAPDFIGEGGLNRTDCGAELRRYFALYEGIDVAFTEVAIQKNAAQAQAVIRMRVSFAGRPRQVAGLDRLLPGTAAYFFELFLVPRGQDWVISRAAWKPADGQ